MPRTSLPPTPAPSADISGKDGPASSTVLEKAFNLPAPAIVNNRHRMSSSSSSGHKPNPADPSPDFPLPPPPTRSRTIIQMKPRPIQSESPEKRPSSYGVKGTTKKAASQSAAGSRKPPTTSAAGKKIARKTAHSVIERRRRSKMNEEFAVLKSMIPACTDQEMHKLAILQASIDYLRYLENCVGELKSANKTLSTPLLQPLAQRPQSGSPEPHSRTEIHRGMESDDENADEDPDIAMEDIGSASETPEMPGHAENGASSYTSPQSLLDSPATDVPHRSEPSSYTSLSSLPSPAFGPQNYSGSRLSGQGRSQSNEQIHARSSSTQTLSTSTSPTILPSHSKEQDHEATTALLMLNQDRRGPKSTAASKSSKRLSVKDLLSS